MNSEGIEDILISKEDNGYTKKKKPKFIFVLFFLLLIVLIAFVGAYLYLTKDTVSSKQLFVQNISKLNVNKLLKNELYTNLIDKMQKESSQMTSSVKFTTDVETEELQDIDVTKFDLNISNSNDVTSKKNYSEAILNYSGNEVFKFKSIVQENEAAIASDEIMNQYVGLHLDKTKDVLGMDIDFNRIKELSGVENIDLFEEEFNEILKKYFEVVLNNIPEEKFSVQQNIAIENATENVEVTNYSVTLSQEELNSVIVKFLEEIKKDENLIEKLIVKGEETEESKEENTTIAPTITPTESSTDTQDVENTEEQPESAESVEGETEDVQPETTPQEENLNTDIPVIHVNPVGTISIGNTVENETEENIDVENIVPETNIEEDSIEEVETIESTNIEELIEQENNPNEQIINIIFGKKANLTKEEFKTKIDEVIKEVESLTGNGLTVNVYSSSNNVEKLNIVLPNDDIVDIDLIPDENPELNSNQSYIKITYLSENKTDGKNGFALEINKEQSTANTTIDAEYSFIEKEKINKKIKISLKTDGTTNSKTLKNDIVVTISTNKKETQIAVDNEIEFKDVTDLPGLNAENCIYLDVLPQEERNTLLDTIKNQITTLYTNKKENLKFIDTNTYSQTTLENQNQSQTQTVTREKAKEVLINKIVEMMDAAIANGEEFTIQNLVDLKIDGYKVSAAVTSENALIVVDVYKFNIDTGFVLTDVE